MKKIILFLLFLGMLSPAMMAQKRIKTSKVPAIVITNFKAKFSDVKKVKWRTVDSLYFASFMQGDKGMDVTFKTKGEWIETMSEIDIKDLPAEVVKGAYNLFTSATIKAAAKVEEATKKTLYILTLKFKGRKVEMTLDALGNQVS